MANSKHKTKSNAQNMPEGALPTSEELFSDMENPMIAALEDEGITPRKLAKQLKSELNARETKVFHNKDILPTTEKCPVCEGSTKVNDKKCPACKGKGLITSDPVVYSKSLISWIIRQKARQDAHKLRGDYPTEKLELKVKPLIDLD